MPVRNWRIENPSPERRRSQNKDIFPQTLVRVGTLLNNRPQFFSRFFSERLASPVRFQYSSIGVALVPYLRPGCFAPIPRTLSYSFRS